MEMESMNPQSYITYECLTCGKEFTSPLADQSKVRCPNCGGARVAEK